MTALAGFAAALLRGQGAHARFLQTMSVQVLMMAVNIGTGLFIARLLGPEGRGSLAAIVFWPQFIASLVLAGLPYALIYHLRGVPEARRPIFGAGLVISTALGVLGVVAGYFGIPYAMSQGFPPDVVEYARVGVVITVASTVAMLLKASLGALDRQGLANRFGLADPVLYLLLLLVAAVTVPVTPQVAATCLYVATALTLGAVLVTLRGDMPPRFAGIGRWFGPVGGYALRAAPAGMLSNLSYHLDRLVLVAMITPHELGLYAVAFSLSRLMEVVKSTIASVGMAAMAGRPEAEVKALHDRVFRFVLYAVTVIVIGGLLFGGLAITLVYGQDFGPANAFFRVLVVEAALSCLGQVASQLFFSLGRPGQVSLAQGISFVASLATMLALVPAMGAMGGAIGLFVGTAVRLGVLLGAIRLTLRLPLPGLLPLPGEIRMFWRSLVRV
ncbi:lipopolysaccharide biosynthesis protein [Siccirubricoccus phaeus]|uniref:lipopolysaccharide biosynthesis protein n=1 Tax=Siccirubricoccus phaeus TaxID=2595053 RepID=UPI00165BA526|nr:oligosaccharide flippase family protein [Siccirubricoccus phaeus]